MVLTAEEYEKARERMVKTQLVATGVQRYSIIERMGELQRELFIPEEFKLIAYSAKEIPVLKTRFLLDPMNLGLLLDRVDFDSIEKVLIIADSTGYVTALLADLVSEVVSIDSTESFEKNVSSLMKSLDIDNVKLVEGDITKGVAKFKPYDLIFINGSVQQISEGLFEQLSEDGKILTALKKPFISQAVFQYKDVGNKTQTEKLFECNVSLLPEFAKASKFNF